MQLWYYVGVEVIADVPAVLIQTYAVLGSGVQNGYVTFPAIMSISLSCFAISYTTTTITFDLDTHPTRRRDNPEVGLLKLPEHLELRLAL